MKLSRELKLKILQEIYKILFQGKIKSITMADGKMYIDSYVGTIQEAGLYFFANGWVYIL